MKPVVALVIYLLVGGLGGFLGSKLKAPGGILVGAMLAVILIKLLTQRSWAVPGGTDGVIQILLGVLVGSTFYPAMIRQFASIAVPVALSTLILVGTGLLIALFLYKMGVLDLFTGYLAASPGAMSALVTLAFDTNANPAVVVTFHFFRLVFVILTAPVLLRLMEILLRP